MVGLRSTMCMSEIPDYDVESWAVGDRVPACHFRKRPRQSIRTTDHPYDIHSWWEIPERAFLLQGRTELGWPRSRILDDNMKYCRETLKRGALIGLKRVKRRRVNDLQVPKPNSFVDSSLSAEVCPRPCITVTASVCQREAASRAETAARSDAGMRRISRRASARSLSWI
ncbi:hypothetical protein ACCO45_011968 [Purpureocillium lilacinum]|uniref:Uncharacterized protein n=1 Tax=Purpureocillium lilacinum TaxID=33203 RepID=A0ACC4DCY5_PURLI